MTPDDQEILPWFLVSREKLADCRVFDVERRSLEREGRPPTDFFFIDSPDWVNVVALGDEDEVVLIEQWRFAAEKITLEIPGGMVDPGETPLESARRELKEETGYTADEWLHLGTVRPNPAIQTNRCHTFLAVGAKRTEVPRFDANEQCRLVLRPYRELAGIVASGGIRHSLVIAALHFEALRRSGDLLPGSPLET